METKDAWHHSRKWCITHDLGCYKHFTIPSDKGEKLWWDLSSPYHKNTHSTGGFLFVDDADLLQTQRKSNETIDENFDELQGSLDTWQGILNASGGAPDCDNLDKRY